MCVPLLFFSLTRGNGVCLLDTGPNLEVNSRFLERANSHALLSLVPLQVVFPPNHGKSVAEKVNPTCLTSGCTNLMDEKTGYAE